MYCIGSPSRMMSPGPCSSIGMNIDSSQVFCDEVQYRKKSLVESRFHVSLLRIRASRWQRLLELGADDEVQELVPVDGVHDQVRLGDDVGGAVLLGDQGHLAEIVVGAVDLLLLEAAAVDRDVARIDDVELVAPGPLPDDDVSLPVTLLLDDVQELLRLRQRQGLEEIEVLQHAHDLVGRLEARVVTS